MKHKILISIEENCLGPELFRDLKPLLNESHKKYLTGIRLAEYFESKLLLAQHNGHTNGVEVSKMLERLQYATEMEKAAEDMEMEFEVFKGKLNDSSLRSLSVVADLMVLDRKVLAPFCGESVLSELISSVHCPVLVLPADRKVSRLMMVYDGSFSSVHALKSFLSIFHPKLRSLPFSVLVEDPESKVDMEQEKVFVDYLKMFFKDIGIQLMVEDAVDSLEQSLEIDEEKPLLLFGGRTGNEVLNCNKENRHITDNNPSFIFKGHDA